MAVVVITIFVCFISTFFLLVACGDNSRRHRQVTATTDAWVECHWLSSQAKSSKVCDVIVELEDGRLRWPGKNYRRNIGIVRIVESRDLRQSPCKPSHGGGGGV